MRFGPTKLIATTLVAQVACLDSTNSMQEDHTTLQKIIELEELILELQLQAAKSVEVLEVFDSSYEILLLQSKQNIEQLKRKNMRLPSAPRIKKNRGELNQLYVADYLSTNQPNIILYII